MNYQEYLNQNNSQVPLGFVNVLAEISVAIQERIQNEGTSWICPNSTDPFITPNELLELASIATIRLTDRNEHPEQYISLLTDVKLHLLTQRARKIQKNIIIK